MSITLAHLRPILSISLMVAVLFLFSACSDDEENTFHPSIITEMADLQTNEDSIVYAMVTDDGSSYAITNELKGKEPLYTYRYICGYTLAEGKATLYTLQRVTCLADSTAHDTVYHDPLTLTSLWQKGHNINMHLMAKTQGKPHQWGFIRDSVKSNLAGGSTYYLSLYHDQDNDPESYGEHIYLTLRTDSVTDTPAPTDSIRFTIHTYTGKRTWDLVFHSPFFP